jgi:hypothetical protein
VREIIVQEVRIWFLPSARFLFVPFEMLIVSPSLLLF